MLTLFSVGMPPLLPLYPLTIVAPHMPPGAFLTQPAASALALADQVNNSPMVRTRYRHAWHLASDAAVRQRFRGLRRGILAHDQILAVYYYRPSRGAWGYKIRRVSKGTAVFLTADGTPLLLQVCGNPVRPLKPAHPARLLKNLARFDPRESESGMVVEGVISERHRQAEYDLPEIVPAIAPPALQMSPPPGREWVYTNRFAAHAARHTHCGCRSCSGRHCLSAPRDTATPLPDSAIQYSPTRYCSAGGVPDRLWSRRIDLSRAVPRRGVLSP